MIKPDSAAVMSGSYCFVCASDKSIFLDVTPENRNTLDEQLVTCLSTKIDESTELSNKICYKCVYELDQCTRFVKKYRNSHKISQSESEIKRPKCCLCLEVIKNNVIFDVTKEYHPIFTPVQKIRNIFNVDFTKRIKDKLVCLSCRYNLDVLYDLKRVHHETVTNLKSLINGAIDYSHFPKVYTDIVNRKTTITTFPDVSFCTSVISDSESSDEMAPGKSRSNKTRNTRNKTQNRPKARKCQQCLNDVPVGTDMYRFYRTGLTVCKKCWMTMDPSKGRGRRQRLLQLKQRTSGTKLCAVFLTDVLHEGLNKKTNQEFEVRRDKDGNRLYIISDESSLDEDRSSPESSRPSVSSKSLVSENTVVNGSAKQKNKRKRDTSKSDVERAESSRKLRKSSSQSTESTGTNELKLTVSSDTEQQPILTRRKRKTATADNQDSDSDVPLSDMIKKIRQDGSNDAAAVTSSPSKPPGKRPRGRPRKSLSAILKGVTSNLLRIGFSNGESETNKGRKKHPQRKSIVHKSKRDETQAFGVKMRSSSNSSVDVSSELKNPEVSESKKEVYACDKCGKEFDTKVSSTEHKLTHLNQPVLKLVRTPVLNITEDQEAASAANLQKDKSSEKAVSTVSAAEKSGIEDPSEEIAINIDDDTDDDEEIFDVHRDKRGGEKKENEEDVKDKSTRDVTEGDDHAEKRCPQIQSIEKVCLKVQNTEKSPTKKSKEPDRQLNAVLNETASLFEKEEDRKNKDTSVSAVNKDVDTTSKYEDRDQVQEDQDSEAPIEKNPKHHEAGENAENGTKISLGNKEESDNERNKEGNLCEEETRNRETVELSDSSIRDVTRNSKDRVDSESSKEEVEGRTIDSRETRARSPVLLSSKNNEDHIDSGKKDTESIDENTGDTDLLTEDPKTAEGDKEDGRIEKTGEELCDLTEESPPPSMEEPEKQIDTIDITDETTELLNDLNDIDMMSDIGIISEIETKQKDKTEDEPIVRMDVNSDKSNNVESITIDLNPADYGQSFDKKDSAKDDSIVQMDLTHDTTTKSTGETEEGITIKDTEEGSRLEGVKSLEELVRDNLASKCDGQQISNVTEILHEIFDRVLDETQKRKDCTRNGNDDDETLENISREINSSADMPSLDPILEMDDDIILG